MGNDDDHRDDDGDRGAAGGGGRPLGRPRSERARLAVLHAVDDLVVEVGYAAVTMTSIAERAGVSRMTLYRWWSTKAEILFDAGVLDAEKELTIAPGADPRRDLATYLEALVTFLARSPAGTAYRALLGEAQHDTAVAALLASKDVLGDTARTVVDAVLRQQPGHGSAIDRAAVVDRATAVLIGPVFFWIVSGRDPAGLDPAVLAEDFLCWVDRRASGRARSSLTLRPE